MGTLKMVKDSTHSGVTASQEDYLEAIFWLAQEHRVARSRDIAQRLDVSKSSVTGALRQLNADGLVNYDPYSFVTLTESGQRIAENVIRRHQVLHEFLFHVLGLTEDHADRFACMIEHTIDDRVLERLEAFMAYAHENGGKISDWMKLMKRERDAE